MNREELMTLLPHRDGMLLLDQLDKEGEIAHGQYHVRGDEWFLQGHFPDAPVVPGVILCEILAQSAGILMKEALTEDTIPMYTSMKNVRFRAPVLPGDTFETKCRITRAKHPFYFAEGEGYVGDTLCVKADNKLEGGCSVFIDGFLEEQTDRIQLAEITVFAKEWLGNHLLIFLILSMWCNFDYAASGNLIKLNKKRF